MSCQAKYNKTMPIQNNERTEELLKELKQTLSEIDRLSGQAKRLLDELDGTHDSAIELRVAQALAALRAKSRMRSTAEREKSTGRAAEAAGQRTPRAAKKAL